MKKLFIAILLIALAICTAVAFSACNEQNEPETPKGDKEFVITTNITDGAEVEEQEYTFTASATYGGAECEVEVALNGTVVEGNGTYTVQLAEGENAIRITAKSGDNSESKNYTVTYNKPEPPKEFVIITNITDGAEVEEQEYTFTASATYGGAECEVEVALNGTVVEGNGTYTVQLAEGENAIRITAKSGDNSESKTYKVMYTANYPTPPTISTSITDNLEIRSSTYNFEVIALDSVGNNISSRVAFAVDWNADDNVENFVAVNGINTVWADSDKTSYSIDFTSGDFARRYETAFIFKITATDSTGESASVEYKLIYIPAEDDESIGKVVFSIEAFTIGLGYLVEPMWVPIYDGVNGAQMLTDIITEYGWDYDYTGRIESGFYLEAIKGIDLTDNYIPDELWAFVEDFWYDRTIDQDFLGEFDYGYGSGWMYSVNGSFYNYGFSDYVPQDGDVVRIQFTLYYGQDIGGSSSMGGGFGGDSWQDEDVSYAKIMMLLADVNSLSGVDLTVYYEVIESVSVWNIKQAEMDLLVERLRTAYSK